MFAMISDDLTMDQIVKILRDDLGIRFPLSSRCMKLFHMERVEDEELHQFVLRVCEDAKYAECDILSLEYVFQQNYLIT